MTWLPSYNFKINDRQAQRVGNSKEYNQSKTPHINPKESSISISAPSDSILQLSVMKESGKRQKNLMLLNYSQERATLTRLEIKNN